MSAITTEPSAGEADVSERSINTAPAVATGPSAGEAKS